MATMKSHLSQDEIRLSIYSNHKKVKNWSDFHAILETMRDTQWIFRGVASPKYYPIPSIGREQIYGHFKKAHEERLFREFKNRAIALMKDPRFNDWDWLAYAQHIGVPTRLLDWTTSPLVAAFFALETDSKEDRVIYAVKYSQYIYEVDHDLHGPFDNTKEGRYTAPLAFDRIRAQRGVFTIHPVPTNIFYPKGMKSILIRAAQITDFRKRLFKYGMDHWYIYPDSQGLGQQLSWQFKNEVGLGTVFTPQSKYY